jgi:hypothetical protein
MRAKRNVTAIGEKYRRQERISKTYFPKPEAPPPAVKGPHSRTQTGRGDKPLNTVILRSNTSPLNRPPFHRSQGVEVVAHTLYNMQYLHTLI